MIGLPDAVFGIQLPFRSRSLLLQPPLRDQTWKGDFTFNGCLRCLDRKTFWKECVACLCGSNQVVNMRNVVMENQLI